MVRILVYSTILDAVVAAIMYACDVSKILIIFFSATGWLFYFWIVGSLMSRPIQGDADYIKMQNNFNLDALRRNSDSNTRGPWRRRE